MILLDKYTVYVNNKSLFAPVDLHVQAGHCAVIMGTSGVGKTSLLNSLCSGLTDLHTTGYHNISERHMVFQDSNQLFPWLTIRENLNLTTEIDYMPLVNKWKLESLLDNTPDQISGGQRQRFTLLRAVCSGKKIILCDEPLSALDAITGLQIANDFRKLVAEQMLTVIWVTHNFTEAKAVGNQIYYLSERGLHDITDEDDLYATILNG